MTEPGVLLTLHTTGGVGSIAVVRGAEVRCVEFEAAGQHAPVVLGEVLRLLAATGVGLDELDAVAVTTGPGSFTGIRVGLATVQGLAAARDLQVLSCDSLRAAAAAWWGAIDIPLAVAVDARRGEVYAGLYMVGAPVPQVVVEPFCAAPGPAARRLAAALRGDRGLAVTGSGARLVVPLLQAAARELGPAPVPVARALADLARAGGCARVAPHELEPTYMRKSDAEVRRQSLRGSGT